MKIDSNMLSTVAAVGLGGWGGYMLYNTQNLASTQEQIMYIVALVVSGGYLLMNNSGSIKSLLKSRPKSARVFSPEDFESQDFSCLIHLRNRVTEANSVDGVETVEKLNSIIFSLHAKERMNRDV